jgi:hypothetical protein
VQSEKNKEKEFDPPAWVGKQQIPQANSGVSINRDEQAGGVIKKGTQGDLPGENYVCNICKEAGHMARDCVCVGGGGAMFTKEWINN